MNKQKPGEDTPDLEWRNAAEQVGRELRVPRRPIPSVDQLAGGLPDERSAESILEDLALIRSQARGR